MTKAKAKDTKEQNGFTKEYLRHTDHETRERWKRETEALCGKPTIQGGFNHAVMPKGSLGMDARGFAQCRLSRKGK